VELLGLKQLGASLYRTHDLPFVLLRFFIFIFFHFFAQKFPIDNCKHLNTPPYPKKTIIFGWFGIFIYDVWCTTLL
jgi:hypothetical protein